MFGASGLPNKINRSKCATQFGTYHCTVQGLFLHVMYDTSGIPTKYQKNILTIKNPINNEINQINEVTFLTFATPKSPNDELFQPLTNSGLECILAGDCDSPRGLAGAISDGSKILNKLTK